MNQRKKQPPNEREPSGSSDAAASAPTLQFLGATGTTTGSRFLLRKDGRHLLVDCGLYQGLKELRQRNWDPFPHDPATVGAVILTHAHIDHTGYLPRLVRDGFRGPVHCTRSTADLASILLLDTAHLQEEDARWANKKGFSRHPVALPLFTTEDAERAIALFRPLEYGQRRGLEGGVVLHFLDAGHILGSAFVLLEWAADGGRARRAVFSGDLGRPGVPILRDPSPVSRADWLVLESTYGDRLHDGADSPARLAEVIAGSARRGGTLLIPSFSVGRTQQLLYTIRELEEQGAIPLLPVFVNSPMARRATAVFEKNIADHDLAAALLEVRGTDIFRTRMLKFVETVEESKALNGRRGPGIVISASGMLTGGRILHHLAEMLPDPANTVLFVGYQAEGTRGRAILEGAVAVKIHGREVAVRARVEQISGFSAHADYQETLAWLRGFTTRPERTFIVHGEPAASASLAEKVGAAGFPAMVPRYGETVELA